HVARSVDLAEQRGIAGDAAVRRNRGARAEDGVDCGLAETRHVHSRCAARRGTAARERRVLSKWSDDGWNPHAHARHRGGRADGCQNDAGLNGAAAGPTNEKGAGGRSRPGDLSTNLKGVSAMRRLATLTIAAACAGILVTAGMTGPADAAQCTFR